MTIARRRGESDEAFARRLALELRYRQARQDWTAVEVTTTRDIKRAYRSATEALAERIRQRGQGTVSRAYLESLQESLLATQTALSTQTMAYLQRGIAMTTRQVAADAFGLDPLVGQLGNVEPVRRLVQGTAEAETQAWLLRRGPDGLTLTHSVWAHGRAYRRDVDQLLENAVVTGRSALDTADQLTSLISTTTVVTPQQERTKTSLGIPDWIPNKLDYRAVRLARTEINAVGRETSIAIHGASPFVTGFAWRVSDRPAPGSYPVCPICDGLAAGSPYTPENVPTQADTHPNCRCGPIPLYQDQDDINQRLASWLQDPMAEPGLEAWYGQLIAPGAPGAPTWRRPAPTPSPPAPPRPPSSRPPVPPPPPPPPAPPPPAPRPAPPPPPFTDARTIPQAIDFAQDSLGVTVTGARSRGADLGILNWVNRDLLELRRQGYALPKLLNIAQTNGSAVAAYSRPTPRNPIDVLHVYRGSDFWKDPVNQAKRYGDTKWWSTGEPTHVVRHELGHKAHYDASPDLYTRLPSNWSQLPAAAAGQVKDWLGREVSKYAATMPHELVAEMFAGAMGGKQYSPQLQQVYNQFGGPPLPSPAPG